MKISTLIRTVLAASMLVLSACGGGDSGSSENSEALKNVIDENAPVVTEDGETGIIGQLGELVDLGDLLEPDGDHWYYTKAAAINDNGTVIGQSNNGSPPRAAFKWESASGEMTFLGKHSGIYEDFYGQTLDRNALESISPFVYSEAVDINTSGTVIGNSTTGTGWPDEEEKRAFLYRDGRFIDLPPPLGDTVEFAALLFPPSFSEAVDINESGEVVLTAETVDLTAQESTVRHAYVWDGKSTATVTLTREDGTQFDVTDVPQYIPLGGIIGENSEAVAINENGQAVVNSGGTAVFYDRNWEVGEPLNHLPGAEFTRAVDINDSQYVNNDGIVDGHIIGNSGSEPSAEDGGFDIAEDDVQGFFWDGGSMYPVNHLGGGTSIVTDINNSDQVVGAAMLGASEEETTSEDSTTDETKPDSYHAILWTLDPDTKKGVIRDLGTLGGNNSFATAINEAGQVTGWSETGKFYEEEGVSLPVRHAFLWDNGVMYDLGVHNDFYDYPFISSYPFSEGVAINENGEVAGSSITINDHYRGFFLSPVFP